MQMKLMIVRAAAVMILLFAMLSGGSPQVAAALAPQPIRVEILLLDVSDFDIARGTYTMDYYLVLQCDQGPCEPNGFELMNGQVLNKDLQNDDPLRKVYRMQAVLKQNMYLGDFPFDRHMLRIVMEDKRKVKQELVYRVGPDYGIADGTQVVGWNLNPKAQAEVSDHVYKVFDETYSQFSFAISVSRPLLAAILKGLFPAFVLMVSGLLSLIMTTDKAGERLGVITSALVGTVLFHLTLTDSVPPVPYLTWADRFMIVNYLVLGLTLAVTGTLVWLQGEHREDLAMRFDPLFRLLIPSLWLTGQLSNLILLERLAISRLWVLVPILLQAAQIYYLIVRYRSTYGDRSADHAA